MSRLAAFEERLAFEVKNALERRDLNYQELADFCGVSKNTIFRAINAPDEDYSSLSLPHLFKIIGRLEIPLAALEPRYNGLDRSTLSDATDAIEALPYLSDGTRELLCGIVVDTVKRATIEIQGSVQSTGPRAPSATSTAQK